MMAESCAPNLREGGSYKNKQLGQVQCGAFQCMTR